MEETKGVESFGQIWRKLRVSLDSIFLLVTVSENSEKTLSLLGDAIMREYSREGLNLIVTMV
jgi:hypothetical protein